MKKQWSYLLVLVLVISMLSGCAKKEEVTKADAVTPVEIWYYYENKSHQEALNSLVDEFNLSQTEVKVATNYIPFADFKKQLSIGAVAEELPDLVILDSPDHASYAAIGIFADITGRFDTSKYFDGPIASATLDGKLYGVPMGSNCLSLFYNKDMLDAEGLQVPATWDELQDVAAKLSKDNVSGLAFCSRQNEEGTFNFMPWVWSTGASSFEIGTENGIEALTFVERLVKSGAMSKEVINWTQGDVMNQFISGNVAMMINGPWQISGMRKEAPELNWDVTLIPMGSENASVLGGENYAVIAGGNEDATLKFLDFATQKEQVVKLMDNFGYISARSDIADAQFTDDAIMQKFVEQMKYAQPRGPHEEWPSISDAISLAFNEVITGSSTPEDAGKAAQATLDSIIK